MLQEPHESPSLDVLRQMLALAEARRAEELQMLERISQYNLALMVFNGSFLSLLITADVPALTIRTAGFLLILSIGLCIYSLWPKTLAGGVHIDDDVEAAKQGKALQLPAYLLATVDATNLAARNIARFNQRKKRITGLAAIPDLWANFETPNPASPLHEGEKG